MAEIGHAHIDHASIHLEQEVASSTTLDVASDHCEHCCHGHFASITSPAISNSTPLLAANHLPGRVPFSKNFGQAPPTPPPNA